MIESPLNYHPASIPVKQTSHCADPLNPNKTTYASAVENLQAMIVLNSSSLLNKISECIEAKLRRHFNFEEISNERPKCSCATYIDRCFNMYVDLSCCDPILSQAAIKETETVNKD